ncbi:MAG: EAL domain-containing protein [Lachnospiraceae bacterium]|jgi:diguanylate cyclase (GGDEF)-like protein|nr:EAL domain-containing protein [Lachnospiraceae bacterium]
MFAIGEGKKSFAMILTFLLVGVIVLSYISLPVSAQSEEIIENLVVGVPTDRCPVFYCDNDTGEIVGIGVDLMKDAAEQAGYKVTFKAIKEETLKAALDNTEYDVILPLGSAITSANGQATVVSDNLFKTPFTLVTLDNTKLPELNKLRIGMLSSLAGGAETIYQLYPGVEISFFDTMDEAVKALHARKVDALLHNSYVWSYVLQKPAYSSLIVQPSAMFSMDFKVGTIDNDKGREVIERLNNGIASVMDTKREAVVLDYTNRRLYKYDLKDYLLRYGPVIAVCLIFILLMIFIFTLNSRNRHYEHVEKMRMLLDYDPLTGVLNVHGFRKKVEEILRDNPDVRYAISYNNIKNFKYINDSYGMDAGDELLCFWAESAGRNLTELDAIARIEADHFAILRHLDDNEKLANDVERVIDEVSNYFDDRENKIRVQMSAGVYALTAADHQDINVDRMIDYARLAEKRLQENHKEGCEFYNPEQWKTGKLVADVAGYLSEALENGEIQVWYQPQIDYDNNKINGAEALCRWNHAKLGWISPGEFIPALEEAGLIYELDCFVWETVCKDLHRWKEQGRHQSVSVNLSRADIMHNSDIPDLFNELIKKYELSPSQLHVEITETAYVDNPNLLITMTQKFREYGFSVEMDDFGSGYSSLNMLKEVQVDRIKLDLHFLTETGDQDKGQIIIRYMIQMARDLGMSLIAEGVETKEQADFLQSCGCSEMQGYHFYKPMPVGDFENKIL